MNNYQTLQTKSFRSQLVEIVTWHFLSENLLEPLDDIRVNLQTKLNDNLNFDTLVSVIEMKDEHPWGGIHFKDEFGVQKSLDFMFTGISTNI